MQTPTLVRIRRSNNKIVQDCDVYIGRAITQGGWNLRDSKWHNPYKIKTYGSVKIVCDLFLQYILESPIFHDIPSLSAKSLGCWCERKNIPPNDAYCHGCVLIKLFQIIKLYDGKTNKALRELQKIKNIRYDDLLTIINTLNTAASK